MDPEPLGLVPLGRKTGGDPPPGEIRSRSSHASNMYITRSTVSRAEASRSTVDPTIHLGASTATDLFVGPATDARQPPRLTTVSPHPTTDGCAESPSTGNMKGRGSKPSAQLKKGHYHTQAGCIGLDDDDDDTPLVISTQARRCYLYVDIPSVPPPSLKRKASASKPTTVRKRKIMAEGNSQRKQPRVSITPRMKRRPPLPPTGGDDEEDFQSQDYAGGFTHMYNSNDRHVGTPEPVDATPASLPLPRANVPRTGPPLRAIRRISRTRIPKKSRTAVPAPTLLRPASADAPIPELCDSTRPLAKEIQGRDADTLAMTDGSGTRRCDNEHDGRPAAAANEAGRTVIDLVDADSEPPSPPVSAPLEGTRNEPLPAMSSALAVPATPKEDHHQFLNNPRPDPVVPHSHGPDVFMREAVAASTTIYAARSRSHARRHRHPEEHHRVYTAPNAVFHGDDSAAVHACLVDGSN
ncbi:hypothetical protein CERSUDRAFT_73027 [Gelatoporia subvermispora B]|uniref:Uncharacterized protein n=1 Tax=Ceriporiopsis subvermispora (strain B) TaxID=914234 RepID=M2RJB5_CERS8|nr:hypothetical protein CERSUDRAFT_73027 [Gelatoporia subvermispora B]